MRLYQDAVQAAELAKQFPKAGRVAFGDVRRRPLRHFPYLLLYLEVENTVWVVALLHGRRGPESVQSQVRGRLSDRT
jgi:plasmid stabilization system protein ParE